MWAGFVFVNAAHEDRPFALIIVQPSGCPARPAGALRGCLAETLRGLERFEESDEEPSDEETTALERFEELDEETTALERFEELDEETTALDRFEESDEETTALE
jgi:hypothetical protein